MSRFISWILTVFCMMATMTRIASSEEVSGSVSVKLNSVSSEMSEDVQISFENAMADFYGRALRDSVSNVTVTVMLQDLESTTPAGRLRRSLQAANASLNTLLMVSAMTTTNMTSDAFSSDLVRVTTEQSAVVAFLLQEANSYFDTMTSVVGSSLTSSTPDANSTVPDAAPANNTTADETTTNTTATVPAPVPAPVAAPVKKPVAAPVKGPSIIRPGPFFNNSRGAKVGICVAVAWGWAFFSGISIMLFYPEDKIPENWKESRA